MLLCISDSNLKKPCFTGNRQSGLICQYTKSSQVTENAAQHEIGLLETSSSWHVHVGLKQIMLQSHKQAVHEIQCIKASFFSFFKSENKERVRSLRQKETQKHYSPTVSRCNESMHAQCMTYFKTFIAMDSLHSISKETYSLFIQN